MRIAIENKEQKKRLVKKAFFCFNISTGLFFVNNINSRFNFEN